ncbi:MAG: GreA/GreB family elongation factor [Deltaproteobacteria bacterium]
MGTRTPTRPDTSRKPGRITAEGYRLLEEQSEALWAEARTMAENVRIAAAEGDRSENAEYIYGKMKLGQIHKKLRFLSNRIEALQIVPMPPPDDGRVHFGCWVEIEDDEGETQVWRLVGPDETERSPDYISSDSPMARALLGRALDDEIVVKRPIGDLEAVIVAVFVTDPGL